MDHGKACAWFSWHSIFLLIALLRVDITTDAGQNVQQIDSLFVGDILGKKSDIADGSLRDWQFRKFENLVGDYYVAPKFLDAMAVSAAA